MIRVVLAAITSLMLIAVLALLIVESRAVDDSYYAAHTERMRAIDASREDIATILFGAESAHKEGRATPAALTAAIARLSQYNVVLQDAATPSELATDLETQLSLYDASLSLFVNQANAFVTRQNALAGALRLTQEESPIVVKELRDFDLRQESQSVFALAIDIIEYATGQSRANPAGLKSRVNELRDSSTIADSAPGRIDDFVQAALAVIDERTEASGALELVSGSRIESALWSVSDAILADNRTKVRRARPVRACGRASSTAELYAEADVSCCSRSPSSVKATTGVAIMTAATAATIATTSRRERPAALGVFACADVREASAGTSATSCSATNCAASSRKSSIVPKFTAAVSESSLRSARSSAASPSCTEIIVPSICDALRTTSAKSPTSTSAHISSAHDRASVASATGSASSRFTAPLPAWTSRAFAAAARRAAALDGHARGVCRVRSPARCAASFTVRPSTYRIANASRSPLRQLLEYGEQHAHPKLPLVRTIEPPLLQVTRRLDQHQLLLCPRGPFTGSPVAARDVERDAVQPGGERRLARERRQGRHRPRERFLGEILGELPRPGEAAQVPDDPRVVAPIQQRPGRELPALRPLDERLGRRPLRGRTLRTHWVEGNDGRICDGTTHGVSARVGSVSAPLRYISAHIPPSGTQRSPVTPSTDVTLMQVKPCPHGGCSRQGLTQIGDSPARSTHVLTSSPHCASALHGLHASSPPAVASVESALDSDSPPVELDPVSPAAVLLDDDDDDDDGDDDAFVSSTT